MKEKIHEIRIRIDGLAKLIYNECNKPLLVVDDPFDLSNKMSMEEMIQEFKKSGPPIMYKPDPITIEPTYSFMLDCHKSLLLGKAWLGKVLAELGEDSPYQNNGTRKTVEDIEPAADIDTDINNGGTPIKGRKDTCEEGNSGIAFTDYYKKNFEYFSDKNYIERIDWLREEIKEIVYILISDFAVPSAILCPGERMRTSIPLDSALMHLSEARFHLGFELQRLKESHE